MIHDTILQRNPIHGDWSDNARIANMLKLTFHGETGWEALNVEQQEALDLIAVKISRILSGDPMHADHWHDIAGYATLAERATKTPTPVSLAMKAAVAGLADLETTING